MTRTALAVPAALVLTLCACSAHDPVEVPGLEVPGGAIGPDQPVTGDLSVLQVQLEYPLDGLYEEGEDARLFLGIANSGHDADTLVGVSGPFARAVDGDGGEFSVPVPADDTVYVGAEGAPGITLAGLEQSLRSSQSVPLTLEFARGGDVTVAAVVAAAGQLPRPTYDFPDPAEDPST